MLEYIKKLTTQNQADFDVYADFPGQGPGSSTVPLDILVTAQKTNLILVNYLQRHMILFGLSVSFKLNITNAYTVQSPDTNHWFPIWSTNSPKWITIR